MTLLDWTHSIALTDAIERTETNLAATLRSLTREDGGTAAARRRRLASEAEAGAQAAATARKRLPHQAREFGDHAEMLSLAHAVDHAAALLAELADAEDDIAHLLGHLAGHDRSAEAARRRRLAEEASASAQSARRRLQALPQPNSDVSSKNTDR